MISDDSCGRARAGRAREVATGRPSDGTGRILTIAEHLGAVGGTETAQLTIFEGLVERGWSVHLLYGSKGDLWPRWRAITTTARRMPTTFSGSSPIRTAVAVVRCALAGMRTRPDVMYLHTPAYLPSALLIRALRPVPIVVHLHQPPAYRQAKWMNRLIRRADMIVVPSEDTAERWRTRAGLDPAKVTVAPIGVDVDRFTLLSAADRRAVRTSLDIDPDVPMILYVGRVERIKGADHLLHAAAAMSVTAQVVVCGAVTEDDYFSSLPTISPDRPPRFLGRRADVGSIMAAADILVVPSVGFETQGLVLVEAMACGTPVVAYAIGALISTMAGFPDQLVATGDIPALTAAMDRFVTWRLDAPDLGDRCRTWVVENLSIESTLARIGVVLQSSVTGRSSRWGPSQRRKSRTTSNGSHHSLSVPDRAAQ